MSVIATARSHAHCRTCSPPADLRDITVEAFPLVLTDVDAAFGLPTWIDYWREHFADGDAAEWAQGVERARSHGQFVYALLYFVVAGTKK